MDKENEEPKPKKKRLSLYLQKKKREDRFSTVTSDALKEMSSYKMPKNSELNSKWAMKNFSDWMDCYNTKNPDEPCPSELLSEFCSKATLNKCLCVYINETRNCKGERYPPKTIYALLCGIHHIKCHQDHHQTTRIHHIKCHQDHHQTIRDHLMINFC